MHLCVYFDLFLRNIPVEASELSHIENIDSLKFKILPTKISLTNMVHKLIKSLGIFLNSIPNLTKALDMKKVIF